MRNSAQYDFFEAITKGPYVETFNRQLWHTSFGRTTVFIAEDGLELLLSTIIFGLGLSAYYYFKTELEKLGLESNGPAMQLAVFFCLGITVKLVKRSTTPYVNANMGGDWHQIYDHQEEILNIHKKHLELINQHSKELQRLHKDNIKLQIKHAEEVQKLHDNNIVMYRTIQQNAQTVKND